MLPEIAIADAYGAGYEFASLDVVMARDRVNLSYVPHPKGEIPAGHYTDDTQMSIALAEMLVDGVEITKESAASKFVEVFKRDPRRGYSSKFYDLLCSVQDGQELLSRIDSTSRRNGAMMRVIPLAQLPDVRSCTRAATAQAQVTHDTSVAITSACVIASLAWHLRDAAIHDDFYRSPLYSPTQLASWLMDKWDLSCPRIRPSPVECDAEQTLNAVLWVLRQDLRSMEEYLTAAVDIGGDTDSVAAIVCGLVSLSGFSGRRSFSSGLRDGLEDDNPYGMSYLLKLDERLLQLRS